MMVASFLLAQHGHSLQAGEQALAPANQAAAWIMSGIVAVLLVAIGLGIFVLVRRAKRGETPEQALIREVREDSKRGDGGGDKTPSATDRLQSWEKDPNWWKKEPISNTDAENGQKEN